MRILVFGGWGQLGCDLAAVCETRHDLLRPTHADADVTEAAALDAVATATRPDAMVNAAAFHKVESCEADPGRSFAVNAVGALNVARAARAVGAPCVYISTDYVFDGERSEGYVEEDAPAPVNVYGTSKAAGERLVRLTSPDSLVVRASGLFGHAGSSGKGGNFVETMLAKAVAGETISVVDDQFFAPTATRDLAERILLFLERRVPPGIYHAANNGSCSWYQFAKKIFELAGANVSLSPRAAGEQAVRRPHSSILLDTRSAQLGLPANRSWEDALKWYLASRPPTPSSSRARAQPAVT
jgi:dTDP-4-dehydrorhamnose reductase